MLARHNEVDDPRAGRAAALGRRAGYDVTYVAQPRRPGSARLHQSGGSNAVVRELRGLIRLARLVRTTRRLVVAGRRAQPFEIVHAHDFETLPAGVLLARGDSRLVYDAHELYADEEPGAPRIYRAAVRSIERVGAGRADAVVTVGSDLARDLQTTLHLDHEPVVVLNCPFVEEVEPRPRDGGPLRALYQGAAGPGRPLGDLLDAIPSAPGVHLTIRVANVDLAELVRTATGRGLEKQVEVVAPVPPDAVVSAAAAFDVGVIINRPLTRNDELVLPNKLFEYLMAGLAVVAPRLPSLTRVVEGDGVGLTFEPGNAAALGDALAALAQDDARLAEMRTRARRLALERYNAEAQAGALEHAWRGG
jgi:glycogen(starch) synthase